MDKLTEDIANELTVEMLPDGIWKTVAVEIGPVNLIKMLSLVNGDDLYVPKPDRFLIPARDKLIKRQFNGYNHDALAARFGLSTAYVRKLCGPGHLQLQCSMFDPPENPNTGE